MAKIENVFIFRGIAPQISEVQLKKQIRRDPKVTYFLQDKIKRRTSKAARNLDTIHRIIYTVFSIWRRLRKKKADRRKGMAEIMRHIIPE